MHINLTSYNQKDYKENNTKSRFYALFFHSSDMFIAKSILVFQEYGRAYQISNKAQKFTKEIFKRQREVYP
jgi:hypothetical protein